MKRLFVQLIIITSIISSCLTCPVFGTRFALPVYAADENQSIDQDEMVEAFKAYMKSRDVTIDGSLLDAVDNFTSSTFQSLCNTLGIDMTALQAEIYKRVDPDSNTLKYWFFTSTGITGFNRIFAQLLQDNDLLVGDKDVDKVIKSGKWWSDGFGGGAFLWTVNSSLTNIDLGTTRDLPFSNLFSSQGTTYKFSADTLNSFFTENANGWQSGNYYVLNNNLYYYFTRVSNDLYGRSSVGNNGRIYYTKSSGRIEYGHPITGLIPIYISSVNKYYLAVCHTYDADTQFRCTTICDLNNNGGNTPQQTDIKIVSPTIKSPLPSTPTNIAPDGRTSPSDKDPTADPVGGTPPDWDTDTQITPDGDGWNIPFTLPDLDIDWSIQGLTKKFPFCIPFDLVNLISVLDVPPEAPRIEGTVNLMVYQWDVDMDFQQFDTVAVIFRNLVYIGFVLGLILITRKLIKG